MRYQYLSKSIHLQGRNFSNGLSYLGVYTLIILGSVVCWLAAFVTFFLGGIRASRRIYNALTESILGTTMRCATEFICSIQPDLIFYRWLDIVPTSRVITRCTQDIRAVDGPLPNQLADIFDLVGYMLFRLLGVVVVTPMFLIPGILVGMFGAWCGQLYIKAQLSVKRKFVPWLSGRALITAR
jgi:ABC-type multidrug transport system fused ATPase/permease subunit